MPTLERSIDVRKALELRLKGLTFEQIGTILCPDQPFTPQAVHGHLSRFEKMTQNAELLPSFQQNRAALLDAAELRLLDSLADEACLAKANYRDRAVSFGIIMDKRRLESGQSTANIAVLSKLVERSDKDLFEK